ncbi:hypothetical protein BLNAU_13454 [Blattamonas nauphoetae]|uniref:Uncharacterized protein n=1 Tax=Blattamonas nauphoetae TaxID=2049346 RepID=A0ABQ9XK42_9EUKA|nr:hypothetical protein BLNAU_13454 [Blattamonas nauphoetae]
MASVKPATNRFLVTPDPSDDISKKSSEIGWPWADRDPTRTYGAQAQSGPIPQEDRIRSRKDLFEQRRKQNSISLQQSSNVEPMRMEQLTIKHTPFADAHVESNILSSSKMTRTGLMDKRKRERDQAIINNQPAHSVSHIPESVNLPPISMEAASAVSRSRIQEEPLSRQLFPITGKVTNGELSPAHVTRAARQRSYSSVDAPQFSTTSRSFYSQSTHNSSMTPQHACMIANTGRYRNMSHFGLSTQQWDRNESAMNNFHETMYSARSDDGEATQRNYQTSTGMHVPAPKRFSETVGGYQSEGPRLIEGMLMHESTRPFMASDDPPLYSSFSTTRTFSPQPLPVWKKDKLVRPSINAWEKRRKDISEREEMERTMRSERSASMIETLHLDSAMKMVQNHKFLRNSQPRKRKVDILRDIRGSPVGKSTLRSHHEMTRGEVDFEDISPMERKMRMTGLPQHEIEHLEKQLEKEENQKQNDAAVPETTSPITPVTATTPSNRSSPLIQSQRFSIHSGHKRIPSLLPHTLTSSDMESNTVYSEHDQGTASASDEQETLVDPFLVSTTQNSMTSTTSSYFLPTNPFSPRYPETRRSLMHSSKDPHPVAFIISKESGKAVLTQRDAKEEAKSDVTERTTKTAEKVPTPKSHGHNILFFEKVD